MAETNYVLSQKTADGLTDLLEKRPSLGYAGGTSGGERQCGWVKCTTPDPGFGSFPPYPSSYFYTQGTGVGYVELFNQPSSVIFGTPIWDQFQYVNIITKNSGYYLVKNYRYWGHCVGEDASGVPVWVVEGSAFQTDLQNIGYGLHYTDNGDVTGMSGTVPSGITNRLSVDVTDGLKIVPDTVHYDYLGKVGARAGTGITVNGSGINVDATQSLTHTIPYVASASLTSSTSMGVTTYSLTTVTKNLLVYSNGACVTETTST